jgi:cob(I)alamin adenosyltransferase
VDDVVRVLTQRPIHVHVVITGRDCPQAVVDIADTVSEIRKVKHAYEAGIPAQRGIED